MFLGLKSRPRHILWGLGSSGAPEPTKRCYGCLVPRLRLASEPTRRVGMPNTRAQVVTHHLGFVFNPSPTLFLGLGVLPEHLKSF
jgi:hypothetical protein